MKKCKLSVVACAVLLVSVGVQNASAAQRQSATQHASASIVFARTIYNGPPQSYPDIGTGLFRINPENGNIVQLTPLEIDSFNSGGSWSPAGHYLVYTHTTTARRDRSQLFVVNRRGVSQRITYGAAIHRSAVWGPGTEIAFITDFGSEKCLSTVRADGTHQRLLFCPVGASKLAELSGLKWSLDGKSIYVDAWYGASPKVRSTIWRVNVATGLATRIFALNTYWGGFVDISRDGTRAIFTNTGPQDPATLVDLTTGTTTVVQGEVRFALFSPNGRRIAFQRDGLVNVMKADGTHQHRVTDAPRPMEYNIRAWSKDNCHILFDPYLDQFDELGNYNGSHVWIVDANTHAITKLARGAPTGTGWYEP